MATILDYLQQIRTARYGKEVRSAIANGIEQCYNDGHAGSIDLQARQDIETLETEVEGKQPSFYHGAFTGDIDNLHGSNTSLFGYYNASSSTASGTHPYTGTYMLLVFGGIQIAIPAAAGQSMKWRNFYNAQWYDWKSITSS